MRQAFLLAVAILCVGATPSAGAELGRTTLTLEGAAVDGLRAQGVAIRASKPATATRWRVVLPVSGGAVTASARLDHAGALTLRAGLRNVRLTRLRAELAGDRIRITALLRGRRTTLLTGRPARGALRLDAVAGSVTLRGTRLTLARGPATTIRRSLALRRARAGAFGTLSVDAAMRAAPSAPTVPAGPPAAPPQNAPIADEPPVLSRSASAVDIANALITWAPRPSFIRYVNSGEGTRTSGGATADPPSADPEDPNRTPLVYTFHYPFARGWFDPASGSAATYHRGAVNFAYRDHGIDLDAKEPEIELNGPASRAIFRFSGRDTGDHRAVLVNLDVAKAAAHSVTLDGKTHTYERIPGSIPAGTSASVFAGFYQPGDPFGWVSLSFTTP